MLLEVSVASYTELVCFVPPEARIDATFRGWAQ